MNIDDTLIERGRAHGDFVQHAALAQAIQAVMQRAPSWPRCTDCQKTALEMIIHKLCRIICGNPNHADSWHDIQGYARLAEKALSAADAPSQKQLCLNLEARSAP